MEKINFKNSLERAYVICSTDQLLEKKLKHFENVFHEINNFPKNVIKQILDFEEHSHKNDICTTLYGQNEAKYTTAKKHMLVLLY